MDIAIKQRLLVGSAIIVALFAAWQIANENLVLAGLITGALLVFLAGQLVHVPLDALVGGTILFGYLVGNRGFAQLYIPQVPLLPGELALGFGAVLLFYRSAAAKALPFRPDALNYLVLLWFAFGLVRLRWDLRNHGFVALRDFATVYYCGFFFLAQHWHADIHARRWIERCLMAGFILTAPVFLLFTAWPEIFITHFNPFGVPLVYVKSDVAAGFMVAGTFWLVSRYLATRQLRWLLPIAISLVGIAFGNSRAALVGLFVACMWLVICRRWQWLRPIVSFALVGALIVLLFSAASRAPWTQTPAYRLYESAVSIFDFEGSRVYLASGISDKPDNNQFRLIWWRAVFDEVWDKNPWLGLGFGYDLADQFMRVYYAEGSEEFSARSPHNILLTLFGRMGIAGLLPFLAILAIAGLRTWHAGRAADPDKHAFPYWIGVWGIFATACFGVVLEGPMGAAIFWSLLGLAHAATVAAASEKASELAIATPAHTHPDPATVRGR